MIFNLQIQNILDQTVHGQWIEVNSVHISHSIILNIYDNFILSLIHVKLIFEPLLVKSIRWKHKYHENALMLAQI